MGKLIAQILLEGMQTWNSERRLKVSRDHKKVLDNLNKAVNAAYPDYTDAAVGLAEEEKEAFLLAYHQNQLEHKQESENA
jgi:hypothetical protein